MDEAQLAREAAAGSVYAFTCLTRLHERDLRRFTDRLSLGTNGDDIAQEAFMKAWQQRATWRGGSYRAWLKRIAWTCFLDSRRADRRRGAREQAAALSTTAVDELQADSRLDLHHALARLADLERAAASLCFGDGYSHQEAAEILGIPLGTCKSAVARARTRLTDMLGKADDGYG